jgi:hypothetical protein
MSFNGPGGGSALTAFNSKMISEYLIVKAVEGRGLT